VQSTDSAEKHQTVGVRFTGERMVAGKSGRGLEAEHISRYLYTASLLEPGRVPDYGRGAGYGSAILANAGFKVVAVDICEEAARFCRHRYGSSGAHFIQADCSRLPFAGETFDGVVPFKVVKHVDDYLAYLLEAHRVLRPGGLLVLSTPNELVSDLLRIQNPFHRDEFYVEELRTALSDLFVGMHLAGQTNISGLFIGLPWSTLPPVATRWAGEERASEERDDQFLRGAQYLIAVCRKAGSAPLAPASAPSQIYIAHGRSSDLLTDETLSRRVTEMAESCVAVAGRCLQGGDLDSARLAVQQALRLQPQNPDLLALHGRLAIGQGDLAVALKSLALIARLRPEDADAHTNLGLVLLLLGRSDDAEESFRRAMRLNPAQRAAREALGRMGPPFEPRDQTIHWTGPDLRQSHAPQPEKALPSSFSLDESRLQALLDVLMAPAKEALDRGDLEGAAREFARLVEQHPDLAAVHTALGSTLMALVRPADAVPHLRRATELAPNAPALHNQLGVALFRSGDAEGAEAAFSRARHADPNDMEAILNLVHLHRSSERYVEATGLIKEALTIDPNHPDALATFATLCLELGDREGAEMGLQRLAAVAPNHPEAAAIRQAIDMVQSARPSEDLEVVQ